MHRVPDAPRLWLMPDQNIPFKSFKALQNRQLKAISLLESDTATTPPNPNLSESVEFEAEEGKLKEGYLAVGVKEEIEVDGAYKDVEDVEHGDVEKNEKVSESSDNEKRRKEAEEKLQALNPKKHCLVQLLKQHLGMQLLGLDPKQNNGAEMESVEAYDASNHMSHARPLSRMSSMSPSSESPSRRFAYFQHNTVVPHPSRSAFGAASMSPSRFAPTPPQVIPASFRLFPQYQYAQPTMSAHYLRQQYQEARRALETPAIQVLGAKLRNPSPLCLSKSGQQPICTYPPARLNLSSSCS